MKKIMSAVLSAAILGSMAAVSVHAAEPVVTMGEDIMCAPGQTLHIPISVTMGDDYESSQWKLIFGEDGSQLKSIKIEDVKVNANELSLTFKEKEDYVNLVCYANMGKPIPDGKMLTLDITIPEEDYLPKYDLILQSEVFAGFKTGSCKVDDVKLSIEVSKILGDANGDGKVDVRDCAKLAHLLANMAHDPSIVLPTWADFNKDGVINVRDCAAIAKMLASTPRQVIS